MNYEIFSNQITVVQKDDKNILSWTLDKESFKKMINQFTDVPQNVIEWMNS